MAILDIFKKKRIKKEEKKVQEDVRLSSVEVKKPKEKPLKKVEPVEKRKEVKGGVKTVSRKKTVVSDAYRILKSPHITEKATDLTKKNQYVFKVYTRANKVDIRKAIENVYGVSVLDVNIINIPQKKRRLGKITGWRKGYKKAIVKIKKGQKIEILPR